MYQKFLKCILLLMAKNTAKYIVIEKRKWIKNTEIKRFNTNYKSTYIAALNAVRKQDKLCKCFVCEALDQIVLQLNA